MFDGSTKLQGREKHIHVKFLSGYAFKSVSEKYRINEDTFDRIPVKTITVSATVSKLPPVFHDDVIKWKHFPRNWPFAGGGGGGFTSQPVNFPYKGQWRGALILMFLF